MIVRHMSIEEPTTKSEMWYDWLEYRIRRFMIIECVFFVMFVFLISKSFSISDEIQRTHEMMYQMQLKIDSIENRLSSRHYMKTENTESISGESQQEISRLREMNEKLENEMKAASIESIMSHRQSALPSDNLNSIPPNSTTSSREIFNAASMVAGASIVDKLSSHTVSAQTGGYIRSGEETYVLLDRKELPLYKAWCSDESKPRLTINLAKYVKPISVSYQHTKWNGLIPDDAPRIYDVVNCLDNNCKKWDVLVSNCEYKSSGYSISKQEQTCLIQSNRSMMPVNTVQFRFRENYGNKNRTCAYLVRVYGERTEPPEDRKAIERKEEERESTCSWISWQYNNFRILYNARNKTCPVLYENNCCIECPECCMECTMTTSFSDSMQGFLLFIIVLGTLSLIFSGYVQLCKHLQ
ncbi:hypothetical protein GCK72_014738 [Caenorhabditis remanei]|uniref:SUN domain-containing protein n=1 Tax=Caenorhabditis remanei TaxID=31234 RepID=A0A6A5GS93_CAERE|nr:hypothetical protein GCK72_014738 [Caenorhabditis remanei]KAF1758280.1 hypothetical protein GCK72_014738 [Caenorhabditis remanei]